jgi:hypothetical protein
MTYLVVSPLVGEPGSVFTPKAGVNVDALLAGGFIVPAKVSTETAPKRRKVKPAPEEKTHGNQSVPI